MYTYEYAITVLQFSTSIGGSDFFLLDNMVRFPQRSNVSDPFRLRIINDENVENLEDFFITIIVQAPAKAVGARLGGTTEYVVRIEDDDSKFAMHAY